MKMKYFFLALVIGLAFAFIARPEKATAACCHIYIRAFNGFTCALNNTPSTDQYSDVPTCTNAGVAPGCTGSCIFMVGGCQATITPVSASFCPY